LHQKWRSYWDRDRSEPPILERKPRGRKRPQNDNDSDRRSTSRRPAKRTKERPPGTHHRERTTSLITISTKKLKDIVKRIAVPADDTAQAEKLQQDPDVPESLVVWPPTCTIQTVGTVGDQELSKDEDEDEPDDCVRSTAYSV